MIRAATVEDIPKLVKMGRDFYSLVQIANIPYSEDSITTLIKTMIEGDDSTVFVNDEVTGAIGGFTYPFWANTEYKTGSEAFWWVEKGTRQGVGLALWTKLESWAKKKETKFFQMSCLECSDPIRLENMYRRRGYVSLERNFTKVL